MLETSSNFNFLCGLLEVSEKNTKTFALSQQNFEVHKYINNIIVKSSMKSQQVLKFQQDKLKRELLADSFGLHHHNFNISSAHLGRGSWNENRMVQIQAKSKRRNSIRAQNYSNMHEKPVLVEIKNRKCKNSIKSESANYFELNETFARRLPQKTEEIRRFSDIKKDSKKQQQKSADGSQSRPKLKCENHPKRLAKFYITSTQQRNIQFIHHYCLECSINLSKKNFKVKPLLQKYHEPGKGCSNTSRFESCMISLISQKNQLNEQCELVSNNESLSNVEHTIKETEQKYVHYRELLAQIEKQEMSALLKLKADVCSQIKKQIRQIHLVKFKIEQFIDHFGKQWKNGQDSCSTSTTYEMKEIQRQLDRVLSCQFNVKVKLPKTLSTSDISHKLESLFTKTVHELSFEQLDSEIETAEPKQGYTFYPISSQKPEQTTYPKLHRYLFNQSSHNQVESSEDCLNFNSTLRNCLSKEESHQMVEGIDFALSMTGSFCDQENIMMNI